MDSTEAKRKATSSVAWTMIERFACLGISFISDIILARLLMPEDYGTIGMLAIFMTVAQQFLDGGLGTALIQKKKPTQVDYSTVFYWNLALSILLYFVLFFTAPFIASFYKMPVLCPVLRVQALILIISALKIVQSNQLVKQFCFKKISIVQISSSLLALVITVVLAYKGFGVWALVVHNLTIAVVPSVIYWITNKWKPSLVFSWSSFKELFSFGVFVFLSNILTNISNNVQGLLIGRFFNATTMGYYSKANSTSNLASHTISQTLSKVTFPLYASMQDNKEELISTIRRLTTLVAYLTYPLMFILILLAKPIILLLYTEKWSPCVPYFQILCVAGLAICLQALNKLAVTAVGKSKANFNMTVVKSVLCLSLISLGFYVYGITGLLIGMVIYAWVAYIINASLVSKYIGLKLMRQLADMAPILILTLAAFISAMCMSFLHISNMYVDGIIKLIVFVIVYLTGTFVLRMPYLKQVQQLAKQYLSKKK